MTIASTVSRATFPGAGSTGPFAYPFKINVETDLRVIKRPATGSDVTLNWPTDFTVTGVGNAAGGNVTLTTALAVGETIVIRRKPPLTQATSIRNQGPFFASVHEDEFDRLVMQLQGLQDEVDRSFKLAESLNSGSYNLLLPNPDAGKVVTGTGTGFTMSTLDASAVALPGESRTVSTLSAFLFNNRVFNVLDYGAPTNGSTDATAAFTLTDARAALFGGIMFIPPCINGYKVSGFVQTCKTVMGSGQLGKLTTTLNATIYSFGADDIGSQDVCVQGNSTGGAQNGFGISNRSKFRLINPTCFNCGGAGIYATQTLGTQFWGGRIVGAECYGNLIGIQCDVRAEYVQVIGGKFCENTTGIWDTGGNCTYIGCDVNHNTDGFRIETGVNDSHGCAIGCKVNHNTQYEIRVNGIANGFVFSGCHIFEHDLWLKNCFGVQFVDCELSLTNYYFEGSTGTLIESCVIDPSYGNVIQNNFNASPSHTQWRNNRKLDGTAPTFLENINGCYLSGLVVAGTVVNAAAGTVVFGTLSSKASNNATETKYALYNAGNNRIKNWGLGGNKVRVQLLIKMTYTATSTVPQNVYADIGYYVNDAGARLIAAGYLPIQIIPNGTAGTILFRFDGFLDLDALSTFDVLVTNNTGGTLTYVASESYIRVEGL